MQAHREKIRRKLRAGILEKAVITARNIPPASRGDYVSVDDTFEKIAAAFDIINEVCITKT